VPIVLERGEGAIVWDVDGKRFIDLAAGFGSMLLGHGAEEISRAVAAQLGALVQGLGDLHPSRLKVELLERLAKLHADPRARVLLCQSGADAITGAIKTAALATGKHALVAFEGAYHGLGYAPLAACGYRSSFREPFAPELNPSVRFVPYPASETGRHASLEALRRALAPSDVSAVLIEPILGRGGVVVPPHGFLGQVRDVAHENGALVIVDEIWTGLGRSGAMLRSHAEGLHADILCLGKGLGGGLSISACIGSEASMDGWARGGEVLHTSTHAGAPLACAAAIALLDAVEARALPKRAAEVGAKFQALLREAARPHAFVADVRGSGLMIGVEHTSGELGLRVMKGLLDRGVIVTTGAPNSEVIVFTPPLVIAEEELRACVAALSETWSALGA